MNDPESNENENENIIQSLDLNFLDDKKENEDDFSTKMNSLMSKLEVELNNVKKYTELKAPLNPQDIKLYPINFTANNNLLDNNDIFNINFNSPQNLIEENYIELNKNKENDKIILKNDNNDLIPNNIIQNEVKDNNLNNKDEKNQIEEKTIINEYKFGNDDTNKENENINEENLKQILELKGSQVNESQAVFMRLQQELKEKEKEKEELKMSKKEEELKRREEELNRREAEFNRKEEERKRKEEFEREKEKELDKNKKKEGNIFGSDNEKIEDDEEAQRDKLLGEEFDRLRKEEKEKEEEEKRENERIKKERMIKEQKEKEEEERKRKEKEKKKELERKKKEEELKEENELQEQINKQKIEEEDDEVKIVEVDDDDEIQELEGSFNNEEPDYKSRIKQCIIKANPQNNNSNEKIKKQEENKKQNNSSNNKINDSKNKNINSANNKNKDLNKSNNKNMIPGKNLKDSRLKKSQIKQSINSNGGMKKPKQQKEPEKDFQEPKAISISEKRFMDSKGAAKLPKEKRDEILKYISAVENFDTKNPDLDGIQGFPIITKFENKEKSLTELIPNFDEKIIKKYNEKELEKKVNDFFSGNNFKSDKKSDNLLTEILSIPNESHMDILKKNYEKENLKNLELTDPDEANNIEGLEEKIFSGEEFLPEFYCPFSKLENFQTFIYKYSVHEIPKIMVNGINIFNNWRMTLGDGNSFYRVIMFALIEHYIFEKKGELLKLILNEMTSDQFIATYKLKKIEYKKGFQILSAILMMIENDMEEKAYEFFLKAYSLKDKSFDMLLIIYLKKVIYNFSEEINKLLDEKKKTSEDKDKELIENIKINLEEIDTLFLEPKFNIFYMLTSIFDINVRIFLVTGNFLEPQDQAKFIEDEDEDLPTLTIGYFFSNYHVLYPPNYNNKILNNILDQDNPGIKQLTFILKEKKKCDICYKDTQHIVFLRKKFIACIPCLIEFLTKNVLNERRNKFMEKHCFGAEYYSRPIQLEEDFYLDDYEFIEIFEEKNIITDLTKISKCCNCDKLDNKTNEFKKLKCPCQYCEDCFDDIIKKLTNGLGFLLDCECEKNNNQFECGCKKKYKYKDIKELYDADEEEKEEAQKRIVKYIKENCMICFKNLIHEDKVQKLKMRKESGIPDHFMCNNCYKKCFKEEKITTSDDEEEEEENETKDMDKENQDEIEEDKPKTKPKKRIKKDEGKIFCNICSNWHNYREEGQSCACIIY